MKRAFQQRRFMKLSIAAGAIAIALVVGALISQPAAAQTDCPTQWFFGTALPEVTTCPDGGTVTGPAAILEFERGYMLWFSGDDMITVLYRDFDPDAPQWERYPDTWSEGAMERDPSIIGPLGVWQQPRRGFGELWRSNPTVRERLGWALYEWEDTFAAISQSGDTPDGTMYFFSDGDNKVYYLYPGGEGWSRFSFLG